jgi:DNA-binding NarL/FixJ family response regulator
MARQLVKEYLKQRGGAPEGDPQLTRRERQVLKLIAEGFSGKEIAERLVISPSTVHTHQTNMMAKLNLNSRHELVRYARQHGWIPDL